MNAPDNSRVGHTPGPWDVSGAVGSDRFWIGAKYPCINGLPARFIIASALMPDSAEIGYTGGALNPDVAEANARLIAAAPVLLEGAEDALEALKLLRIGLAKRAPETLGVIDTHIGELECAIAKARGQS